MYSFGKCFLGMCPAALFSLPPFHAVSNNEDFIPPGRASERFYRRKELWFPMHSLLFLMIYLGSLLSSQALALLINASKWIVERPVWSSGREKTSLVVRNACVGDNLKNVRVCRGRGAERMNAAVSCGVDS